MPWVRYFVFIGGALLALLFVADTFSAKEVGVEAQAAAIERSPLRIQSDQRWPERIVIDTTQPTIVPPPAVESAVAPKAVADIDTTTASLEAFAQLQAPAQTPETNNITRPQVKKRKVAKVQRHRAVASAQQNTFDFFAWR